MLKRIFVVGVFVLITSISISVLVPAEANFIVNNLKVEPTEAVVGQSVNIYTDITNVGNISGRYDAVLQINGEDIDTQSVNLSEGETENIQFIYIPKTKGFFNVTIGSETVAFEAIEVESEPKFRVGPTVYLRPVADEIDTAQDGLVEIYIDNPSLNDVTLNFDMRVHVPSGLHVYGQGFGMGTAAGTVYGILEVPPGTVRTAHLNVKADESAVGKTFFIHFSSYYYPNDNEDLYNSVSLTHPFKVLQSSLDPLDSSLTDPEQIDFPSVPSEWLSWPWWAWVALIFAVLVGIAAIMFAVRSRKT
jgi:CARDB